MTAAAEIKRGPLPPAYLFAVILLMVGLHVWVPLAVVAPFPWHLLGILPGVLDSAITVVADQAFKWADTTVKLFQGSTSLVTTGVYGMSCHPMYLGMTIMLLGLGTLLGSATPLFLVPVFALVMDCVFIRVEERMMGETYDDARVRW